MPSRPRSVHIAVAGALAAALALAACGGSSAPGSSAASPADDALAFSKCMREHGIKNFPNPEINGGMIRLKVQPGRGGVEASPQKVEAAQNACKHFQPVQHDNLSPQEKVARQEAVLEFARCMRKHGIDVHASTSGGGVQIQIHRGAGAGAGAGPNPESPAFQSAQKSCQGLLPFKGGPGGGPATSKAGAAAASGGAGGFSVGGG